MPRRLAWTLVALALVASVLAVYASVRGHAFVALDDPLYVSENPHVARGLDGAALRFAFTRELAGNYHPLTVLSHQLDVELFGLDPGAHHGVNAALHALVALLALAFFGAWLANPWAAGLAAALFALHPLRVEAVAWVSERKELLCALFFLGAALAYLRQSRAPSRARAAATAGALALALLAKPMAVTFPLVAWLLDRWPLARHAAVALRRRVLEKLPFVGLVTLGALATVWAQARAGAVSSLGGLPLHLRLLNALASLWTYLRQSVWPSELSPYYPHALHLSESPARALALPALLGGLALVALLALAWRTRRVLPGLTLGLGFFLVTLLPVIGLVQVGTQAHADRYTYLPSIGLAGALVAAGAALPKRPRLGAGLVGLVACALLAVRARAQVEVWRDSRTLFEHALALEPRNFLAHAKLGELAQAEGDESRARAAFERALALNPNHVETLNNLGLCFLRAGELERASLPLERALALAPEDAETWLNLGAVELERGEHVAARQRFESARRLAPEHPDAPYDLGTLALREDDLPEAERLFLEALALDPTHSDAWSNLGHVRLVGGRTASALEAFEACARLAPDDALAHFNLGVAREANGRAREAAESFRRALALDPGFAPARAALRRHGEEAP
jgi:Tfp pilus assembly protein PilF